MKNIVIAGMPRSGKTTFANLVLKNYAKYDIVSIDGHKANQLKNFDKLIFEINITKNKMTIDDLVDFRRNGFIVLVFGYPKVLVVDKINEIIQNNDEDDLSYIEGISEIKKYVNCYIKESKKLKKLCDSNNIMFVDTSKNREEVFKKLFLNIKEKIEKE